MWRDSRKYGIWLHLITQSPSLIPPGIMSSCNNLFAASSRTPRTATWSSPPSPAREKGFVDEPWRRFLASLPVARAVVKLGYRPTAPGWSRCYIQPLLLEAPEPSDEEIVAALGAIAL